MRGMSVALLCLLSLVGCTKTVVKTEFIKPVITHPGWPRQPDSCAKPNFVLLEVKGERFVAQPIEAALSKLECDADKVRYTNQLKETIIYYQEATK